MQVEYRVFGPLEVLIDGRHLELGGHRQQIVLASLLLEAGRAVPVGRLMAAVYGDHPPTSARVQVQICVSGLRRLLVVPGRPHCIITRNQSYVLDPVGCDIDLLTYERLLGEAREAAAAGRRDDAVTSYREALQLWRGGTALEGLDSTLLRSAADQLAEQRLTVYEDCIELELDLGRHRDVIAELTGLIAAHPLRERLRGQLMVALYRSGRQAEALDAYRMARQTLIDELGLEPCEWLQSLERSILTSDPALSLADDPFVTVVSRAGPEPSTDPSAAPPVPVTGPASTAGSSLFLPAENDLPALAAAAPCMLPTDIADFTGRQEEIDEIQLHLARAAENPGQLAVPVIAIVGKPGIGKTTLGVHVSRRLMPQYPGGQLFADLHGRASRLVSPMQILERFLRTLGVPGGSIPDGLEERAEMYRGLLSDRRVLVVLDNVGNEAQVLPLLPGNPRTAVIVTSRSRLGGLPGAIHVDVEVFDPRHSIELLSRIAGNGRVQAETEAAESLANLCGQLPLALRIAGARLSARPHWTVEQLARRLENESRRLDELKHGAMGIRVSISMTYDNISADARRLFRLLAVLDCLVFSGWVGAALLDVPLEDAQDLLDDLADAQLVEITGTESGMHSHYRFHDLIRVFARERLATEEPVADRNAALERALGALLFLAEEAHRRLHGDENLQVHSQAQRWELPRDTAQQLIREPMNWFEWERQSLVAAVRQAARIGAVQLCWDLAVTAVTIFESRVYLNDWRETHKVALTAVRQAGDRRGQAVILYSTGSLAIVEKRFADARQSLDEAAELFHAVDDAQGSALVSHNIAYLERMDGNLGEAARRYESALAVLRNGGDLAAAAYVLHNMAQVELERGDTDSAKDMLPQALELSRRAGSRRIEAQVLHRLGDAHLQADEPEEAAVAFGEALAAVHDLGDPIGEAYALHGIAVAHLRGGDYTEAGTALNRAQLLARSNGERLVEARIAFSLGELALACGKPTQAVMHLHRALGLFRGIQAPVFEARVLEMLTEAYAAAGGDQAVIDPVVTLDEAQRDARSG
ncbi:AfsR/SARP family transcriptional regulator [Actinoplanes regularis]|uniref:AfsR/SARP family transcriptional regulator n=1 Tax=Actinoplanes regularis TaxID=52697 RepID=UPI0024A39922|nr:BTAD domain-containing putative transcriptional regulator [Actinoplanes regularis]GLW33563.1 SARP family transcriptional regulator [Actinoplanes regularis]